MKGCLWGFFVIEVMGLEGTWPSDADSTRCTRCFGLLTIRLGGGSGGVDPVVQVPEVSLMLMPPAMTRGTGAPNFLHEDHGCMIGGVSR